MTATDDQPRLHGVGAAREEAAPSADSPVRTLVAEHLGFDPSAASMLSHQIPAWQRLSLQVGVDAFLAVEGRSHRLLGVMPTPSEAGRFGAPTVAYLLTDAGARPSGVLWEEVESGVGERTPCVQRGMYLVTTEAGPLVLWVREGFRGLGIDVLAATVEAAAAVVDELQALMRERNPYRGHHLQLRADRFDIRIEFAPRPVVRRDELVLPERALTAIEEHAIGIGRLGDRLTQLGRHRKRGLLLYGPPGTGKTHTIRFLATELAEATLFVLTGSGFAWLDAVKEVAQSLTPAIIVLDDVDLVAEDRELAGMAPRQMLFSLLDAMDGMREDADILFVLTSNRPEVLERAVAARPGRIDQAVEIGLPDDDGRRGLLELYGRGLDLQLADEAAILARTDGVTASFIKELLRRAFLLADEEAGGSGTPTVSDAHLHAALDVLLDPTNPLTPTLLGVDAADVGRRAKHRGVGDAWCGI